MPYPGLQQKRAAVALSQAGRAGPKEPTHAIQPAGRTRRPHVRDRRQTSSSLNGPWAGHNKHTTHDLAHNLHLLPFWSNNNKYTRILQCHVYQLKAYVPATQSEQAPFSYENVLKHRNKTTHKLVKGSPMICLVVLLMQCTSGRDDTTTASSALYSSVKQ